MKKSTKTLIIIASLLIAAGLILFTVTMSLLNWDFRRLSTFNYTEKTYEIAEEFEDISVVSDTADIIFAPSKDGSVSVVCYEQEQLPYTVEVQKGRLTIALSDERRWYDYIGIGFDTSSITVYLPEAVYGNLAIKSGTGDLELPQDFTFKNIDVSLSTGDVTNRASALENIKFSLSTGKILAENVTCKNFTSSTDTGNLVLNKVVADETLKITTSTGDVTFSRVDGAKLNIKTDTGNISGSLLSPKVFTAKTNTGIVCVPDTSVGGSCELSTTTGDISVYLEE